MGADGPLSNPQVEERARGWRPLAFVSAGGGCSQLGAANCGQSLRDRIKAVVEAFGANVDARWVRICCAPARSAVRVFSNRGGFKDFRKRRHRHARIGRGPSGRIELCGDTRIVGTKLHRVAKTPKGYRMAPQRTSYS